MKLALMVKNCAFHSCGKEFTTPHRFQIYCCLQHNYSEARYRQRQRQYAAREWSGNYRFKEVPDPPPLRRERKKTEPAYYKKAPRESAAGYETPVNIPVGFEEKLRYLTEDQT